MIRPVYPSALILGYPNMTAAQAEQLCRSSGLTLTRTERGNFALTKPAAPRLSRLAPGGPSSRSLVADAAGHDDEPRAA